MQTKPRMCFWFKLEPLNKYMTITTCSPSYHEEVKTWNRWEALQLLFNPQIKPQNHQTFITKVLNCRETWLLIYS